MTAAPARWHRTWWMAVLFMVGASCFALGALPPYADAVGLEATSITFFAGSLCFTSAAFLQYREAVDALDRDDRRRVWVWAPGDVDWASSTVQLAGTLWFNWSTGNAMRRNLTAASADQLVWRPDALGSAAFLVASGLAWSAVRGSRTVQGRRSRDWWVAALNLLGSVAFGVSAIAAYVVPATDDVRNVQLSNLGTFVGALCFLLGAALLLVPTPPASGR